MLIWSIPDIRTLMRCIKVSCSCVLLQGGCRGSAVLPEAEDTSGGADGTTGTAVVLFCWKALGDSSTEASDPGTARPGLIGIAWEWKRKERKKNGAGLQTNGNRASATCDKVISKQNGTHRQWCNQFGRLRENILLGLLKAMRWNQRAWQEAGCEDGFLDARIHRRNCWLERANHVLSQKGIRRCCWCSEVVVVLGACWSHQERWYRAVRLGVWHGNHWFEDRTGIKCVRRRDRSRSMWMLASARIMGWELLCEEGTLVSCSRIWLFLHIGVWEVTGRAAVLCRRFFRERRTKEFLNSDLLHHRMRALGGKKCNIITSKRMAQNKLKLFCQVTITVWTTLIDAFFLL